MTDSVQIGSAEAFFVFVFCLGAFFTPFDEKMYNFWKDTHFSPFSTSSGSLETGTASSNSETLKALKIARIKSRNVWNTWGLAVFYVIAMCFYVAVLYQILPRFGEHNDDGTRFTTLFCMSFVMLILDKLVPVAIHYYSYERSKWASFFYLAVTWLFAVATTVVLFVWSNNNYAGGLFIVYLVYNTAVNVTMWANFLPAKSYETAKEGAKEKVTPTPGNPAVGNYY